MALRIGALVLATCNLLSASFIDARPNNLLVHHDHDDCDQHDGHKDHNGIHVDPTPHRDGNTHVYGFKPVAASPLLIQDYAIGAGRKDYKEFAHQNVNINIPDVNFKPLKDQPPANKDIKAPITIVTVPRISTVETTRHQVSENYVKNESNLPEHRDTNNFSAKKELLDYNNLLSTKVGPVKEVRVVKQRHEDDSCESDDDHHHHVPQVRPGNLQRKADAQIAVGKAIENAPTVIRTYRVADKTYYHHGHPRYVHGDRKEYYYRTRGDHKETQEDDHKDDHKEEREDHRNNSHANNVKDPFNWLYALVGRH